MTGRDGPTTAKSPPWTRAQKLLAALFVAVLAVQLALPTAARVVRSRDFRVGWEMYAGTRLDVRYFATTDDGVTRAIDAADQAGPFWGHVHYGSVTPKRLCDADPRRVTVTREAVILAPRGTRRFEATTACR